MVSSLQLRNKYIITAQQIHNYRVAKILLPHFGYIVTA